MIIVVSGVINVIAIITKQLDIFDILICNMIVTWHMQMFLSLFRDLDKLTPDNERVKDKRFLPFLQSDASLHNRSNCAIT